MKKSSSIYLELAVAETLLWAGMFYILPALVLQWEADFSWSRATIMKGFTLAILVQAGTAPLVGRLLDRGHGLWVLTGGALVGGCLLMALSFVQSIAGFYLIWAFLGMAMAACLYDPVFIMLTRAKGAAARGGITVVTLVGGFAGTIAYPLVYFLSETANWRLAAWTFGGLCLFVAAPLMFHAIRNLERQIPKNRSTSPENATPFLHQPAFWLLALAFAGLAFNVSVIVSHILPIVTETGISSKNAALIVAMIGPVQVLGRILLMARINILSNTMLLLGCFLCIAGGTLALVLAQSTLALVGLFVLLFGIGNGVQTIVKPLVLREVFGEHDFGAVSGALALPRLATFAIAPTAGAAIWHVGGYGLLLPVNVALTLVAAMLFLLAARSGKRPV